MTRPTPRHARREPRRTLAHRRTRSAHRRPADARGAVRVVAAALATAVLSVVASLSLWSALPTLAGWRVDVVMSGSMSPALQAGDLVLAAPADAGTLWPGQVAVFDATDGRTVVHRVHAVNPDGSLVTKGDANATADTAPVTEVLGLARLRVPWIGLPVVWWAEQDWLRLTLTMVGAVAAVVAAATDVPEPEQTGAQHGRRARRAQGQAPTAATA